MCGEWVVVKVAAAAACNGNGATAGFSKCGVCLMSFGVVLMLHRVRLFVAAPLLSSGVKPQTQTSHPLLPPCLFSVLCCPPNQHTHLL